MDLSDDDVSEAFINYDNCSTLVGMLIIGRFGACVGAVTMWELSVTM